MTENKTDTKILKILLKDFTIKPVITSLAKEAEMSRVGMWKILKRLEKDNLIALSPVGTGKTSAYRISLNWENPLVEKTLALALTEDALKNQRWRSNFAELEDRLDFLIIYGSIIHLPKEASDIDILAVVSSKNRFKQIDESILRIRKTQAKKIHIISLTNEEFKAELKKPNKAFIDALKKGIVLFGQEKFIKFVKRAIK